MIRLNLSPEPGWLDLGGGVRLRLAPLTSALIGWRAPGAVPGGTGLGLAIVDRLQSAQGGTVALHAPKGGGCKITLSFAGATS